jgi:hypothetical protein
VTVQGSFPHELPKAALALGLEVRAARDDFVQLATKDGRLFTADGEAEPRWEWAASDTMADGSAAPDLSGALGWAVECRWEALFCQVVAAVADLVPDLLVVDGDGVVWRGAEVDPDTIRL